jgi:hypothetical protein
LRIYLQQILRATATHGPRKAGQITLNGAIGGWFKLAACTLKPPEFDHISIGMIEK